MSQKILQERLNNGKRNITAYIEINADMKYIEKQ